MTETIKKALELAVHAPSGDNSQPWKFRINYQKLYIYNLPNADDSLYNFRQRGSYISHGALIENLEIISRHEGYNLQIELFPKLPGEDNLVAIANFIKTEAKSDGLYQYIKSRATNRKPYLLKPLSNADKKTLLNSAGDNIRLLEDQARIKSLGKILSLNERLVLENYFIHKSLFSFIRWTPEEELKYKTGLYIKTLELAPAQELAFKLFRSWKLNNFLAKLGTPKMVSRDTAKVYASAAAYGMIIAGDDNDTSFIKAGKIFQRVWLEASKIGLSLQPTAALLYLAQRIHAGDSEYFSREEINSIIEAENRIKTLFNIATGVPTMLFRLGYSEAPSARSLKKPPEFVN